MNPILIETMKAAMPLVRRGIIKLAEKFLGPKTGSLKAEFVKAMLMAGRKFLEAKAPEVANLLPVNENDLMSLITGDVNTMNVTGEMRIDAIALSPEATLMLAEGYEAKAAALRASLVAAK